MKKIILNIVFVFVLYFAMASLSKVQPNDAFINTIYTISGIMFSIGMGIIGTINFDKVLNMEYYNTIKANVILVRTKYLVYFCIISFSYAIYQLLPQKSLKFMPVLLSKKMILCFDLYYFAISLNIVSIAYFIINFIEIQRLNFEISEKSRK